MLIVSLLFLALLVGAVVYGVRIYNGLVALRENVRKAWANIDVLLTQRHEELPKLVETCKRYMAYEQETLERVMQARAAVFRAQGQGDVTRRAIERPLQHHVLEHVGHPHALACLVNRRRSHPGPKRDRPHSRHGLREHGQSVR